MEVVNLVVLACVLRATTTKKLVNFFEEKVHPLPEKILATPINQVSISYLSLGELFSAGCLLTQRKIISLKFSQNVYVCGKSFESVQCAMLKACDACADIGQL